MKIQCLISNDRSQNWLIGWHNVTWQTSQLAVQTSRNRPLGWPTTGPLTASRRQICVDRPPFSCHSVAVWPTCSTVCKESLFHELHPIIDRWGFVIQYCSKLVVAVMHTGQVLEERWVLIEFSVHYLVVCSECTLIVVITEDLSMNNIFELFESMLSIFCT